MSPTGPDTLVIDLPAARRLALTFAIASDELFSDQLALRRLLDDATRILRFDCAAAMVPLASARRSFDGLATDLRTRLRMIDCTVAALADIDDLSRRLTATGNEMTAAGPHSVHDARRQLILRLVGGDMDHTRRIEAALAAGFSASEAFRAVHAELQLEARVDVLMVSFGIDDAAAREMITRVDRNLLDLAARGIDQDQAVTALAIVENFGLDLAVALDHADESDISLLQSLGQMLTAHGLGVSLAEYGALKGLEANFAALASAGDGNNERVSAADLRHVVEHPWLFAPSQVLAAQALLDQPMLRNRLDTADSNAELFAGASFGSTQPGDGLISEVDVRAIMLKAQLHQILHDYADEIDVANDPSGVVDGFRSQSDFRAFIADNPDLPASVLAAAEVALDSGWFDESWWQEHKDEIAMGAALVAAGLVVVASGGAASLLLVVGAGALAAGTTTIAVNIANGEPMLDDAFTNAVKGGFIGVGVHGVSVGMAGYATASTSLGRAAAFAGVTSGAADVVAAGGVDLLLEEEYEDLVHEVAEDVAELALAVDVSHSVGEWSAERLMRFATVEEQVAALSDRISDQRQLRHIAGSASYENGGYFDDLADAQRVLDAIHDGTAEVLAITRGNELLVRYSEVAGIHMPASLPVGVPTDLFLIEGTALPRVVPTGPDGLN